MSTATVEANLTDLQRERIAKLEATARDLETRLLRAHAEADALRAERERLRVERDGAMAAGAARGERAAVARLLAAAGGDASLRAFIEKGERPEARDARERVALAPVAGEVLDAIEWARDAAGIAARRADEVWLRVVSEASTMPEPARERCARFAEALASAAHHADKAHRVLSSMNTQGAAA
jgi:hypothetical protein